MQHSEAEKLISKFNAMKMARTSFEDYYFKSSMVFDPRRAIKWCGTDAQRNVMQSNGRRYSSAGVQALNRNTNFFQTNATPASGEWFRVNGTDDAMDLDHVADWCKMVERKVHGQMRETLYRALAPAYRDMFISYGVIYQGFLKDRGDVGRSVQYEYCPSNSVWFERHPTSRDPIRVAYSRSVSPRGYFELFNKYPAHCDTEEKRNSQQTSVELVQMVNRETTGKNAGKFVEYWIDVKNKELLSEDVIDAMPFFILSLKDEGGDDYSAGIAYDALPDMRAANNTRKAQQTAIAFGGSPPLLTHENAAVSKYGKHIRPGGILTGAMNAKGAPLLAPLAGLFNPEVLTYAVSDDENRVREMLWQSDMVQNHDANITATQARIIAAERAAMVAPFVTNITPTLSALCERHIALEIEKGSFGSIPKEIIEGDVISIDIVSQMSLQARANELGALFEAIGYIMQLAQIRPEVVQGIDLEDAVSVVTRATGTESIFSVQMMNEFTKKQEDAMAQQQQIQMEGAQTQVANEQADLMGKLAGGDVQ